LIYLIILLPLSLKKKIFRLKICPSILDPHHLLDPFISSEFLAVTGHDWDLGPLLAARLVSLSKKSCLVVSRLACLSGKLARQSVEILASPTEPNQISCLGKVGTPTHVLMWAASATTKTVSVPPNWRRCHQIRLHCHRITLCCCRIGLYLAEPISFAAESESKSTFPRCWFKFTMLNRSSVGIELGCAITELNLRCRRIGLGLSCSARQGEQRQENQTPSTIAVQAG
jgi:hypothetical protein